MKVKTWTTEKADRIFSRWIRDRDKRCMRCGKTENLQCSHFWSRRHSSVRYDPKNCVAACAGCHLYHWEVEKQGHYRDFMIQWLGQEEYDALMRRAQGSKKRTDAIRECMRELGYLEEKI